MHFFSRLQNADIILGAFAVMAERESVIDYTVPYYDLINKEAELAGDLGIDIISTVRKFKSENKLSLKEELNELILISEENDFQNTINSIMQDLKAVLNIRTINFSGKTSLESERFNIKIGINK